MIGDAVVYKGADGRDLRVFGQAGIGDSRVDRFGWYAGGGVDIAGVIPGRPNDEVGIALAMARNGGHFIASQTAAGQPVGRAETTVELAYLAQVTSWLHVQPDLQYVFKPNTDPRVPNALVGLLRVELAF